MTGIDLLLFAVLPYIALAVFFLMTIRRYRTQPYTYSSLSSQFLENHRHFWGIVPFHFGVITVLAGHVAAFLLPRELLWWNSRPVRLYVLEVTALIAGLLTIIGMSALLWRRVSDHKVRRVTTAMDWVVLWVLLAQIASGLYVALFHPWGSSWFAAALTPYLWSLVQLNPQIGTIAVLPLFVKVHIAGAWILIALFPFTRLVHILVVPNPYLWRKPQVVRWYRRAEAH
jgi:nitrate reductase gamma subunit